MTREEIEQKMDELAREEELVSGLAFVPGMGKDWTNIEERLQTRKSLARRRHKD